ncbi:helix-turn-helix domain-containing protein [Salinimonas sp. HHU 13199]|uniref:Helix-turn-helix domain-containing protein n=1 Tax=Salinimonas profundi TaxID=2729140 RepID=A0ABR8LMZ8_9ALTE|nr:helix-turn-helix transcriptional regulator [Salinimonas profundi]MBD3587568.1 helix-turn-helix domain-containing protein [Salinimonas profundi]
MKINTPKDLSALLRDARKAKKMNQAELAKQIGVYQRVISNCETMPEKMSVDMLLKLSAALNLDIKVERPQNTITTRSLSF